MKVIDEKYKKLLDYCIFGRGQVDCDEIKNLGCILDQLSTKEIERNVSNMYLAAPKEFADVEGIVSYMIIWCTGNEYYGYRDITSSDELVNDLTVADFAELVVFEGKRLLLVAEKY